MDQADAEEPPPLPPPTCRVAVVGAHRQRVARVAAILHADDSLGCVETASLTSTSRQPSTSTSTIDEAAKGVPPTVQVEYLPCVASFDAYEDESGESVRYLASLEYNGPNGTLAKGKSLAPFFDEAESNGDGDDVEEDAPFPGISAVTIGCGIESEEDVEKVKQLLDTLSASCAAQASTTQSGDGMLIECIQPNAEHSSMSEENDAFRNMTNEEKKEATLNRTIGPGKMAKFAHSVAERIVRRKWNKEFTAHEQSASGEMQQEAQPAADESPLRSTAIDGPIADTQTASQPAPETHAPNPEKIRYACKRCRTVLFGVDDLEDPPHAQSQHDFRKRGHKAGQGSAGCQNHFIAQTLPWMNGCSDVEGKFHCPKCNTKVGHYSWTGAQCSCGTWVTPALMIPVSKVDTMRPISQNVIAATGALFIGHSGVGVSAQAPAETSS